MFEQYSRQKPGNFTIGDASDMILTATGSKWSSENKRTGGLGGPHPSKKRIARDDTASSHRRHFGRGDRRLG